MAKKKTTKSGNNLPLILIIIAALLFALVVLKFQKKVTPTPPEERLTTKTQTIDNQGGLDRANDELDSTNVDAAVDDGLVRLNSDFTGL